MFLDTQVDHEFLDIFFHEIDNERIPDCKCDVNLFILRIESNGFAYGQLVSKLENEIIKFALTRQEYNELLSSSQIGTLYRKAVKKLRVHSSNDGELGEIMLFCYLDSHGKAPKLITKLQLKTSSNDYVKGADGIHIADLGNKNYELIFGESKLYKSLTAGLTDSFTSIKELITRPNNNIDSEIGLIHGNVLKECNCDEQFEFIKEIILPKAKSHTKKDNSFCIFIGFEIEITQNDLLLGNREFEKQLKASIIEKAKKSFTHIQNKINELDLLRYKFRIYFMPFIDIDDTRKNIIKNLMHIE